MDEGGMMVADAADIAEQHRLQQLERGEGGEGDGRRDVTLYRVCRGRGEEGVVTGGTEEPPPSQWGQCFCPEGCTS